MAQGVPNLEAVTLAERQARRLHAPVSRQRLVMRLMEHIVAGFKRLPRM
jgi:hypothetical protein